MDKNNDLFENNNINLLKGNIKKYFQKLENNNINLLEGNIKKYFQKLENNNINLLEENIKKYFQKLENNNILYEPVQPAAPPVQPAAPPVQPAAPPVQEPADEEYLVFNIDENKIIKICNYKNNEEFINDYKHFVQENIVEEIKIGREIISKIELKQKINNNIINNAFIIKIKKQIYELYDLDDTLLHSYNSKKNRTKESIDDLLISNSQPINNINMFLKIKQDSENYYFAEYINRSSLSWTKPYLIIVDVILREEYKKYMN